MTSKSGLDDVDAMCILNEWCQWYLDDILKPGVFFCLVGWVHKSFILIYCAVTA